MKKLIMIFLAFTAVYAVSAQEVIVYKSQATGTYNAYSIPEPIKINFQSNYGDPTIATWHPMNGWMHATYRTTDGRITHVYYSTQPYYLVPVPDRVVDFKISLPVTNTFVPEDVIATAINRYGGSLYSITKLMTADNQDAYQVSLLENGTMRTVIMNHETTAKAGE